jgi:voltage-gated potassium channel
LTGFNSPIKRQDFRQAMRDRSRVGLFIWPPPKTNCRSISSRGGILVFGLTVTFLKQFGIGLWLTFPLLLSLAAGITLLGQTVGRKEGWSRFDSFYWSFITATTVGYGDIRPVKRGSRILAILIAFLGLVLTGIVIAVAVRAGSLALGNTDR